MERRERQRLVLGRTFVETLILTLLQTTLTAGMKYEDYVKLLSKILEEEIETLCIRFPALKQKYVEYVKKYFNEVFGEKIPVFKIDAKGNVRSQIENVLIENIEKVIPKYRSMEKADIEREIDFIVSKTILIASKSLLRDIGEIR